MCWNICNQYLPENNIYNMAMTIIPAFKVCFIVYKCDVGPRRK